MTKKLILPALAAVALSATYSCTGDDGPEYVYEESTSAAVSAFKLKNDAKVLDSLSNVFFTIDLLNGQIYNADSLPYGTRVRRLVPSITYATNASWVTLEWARPGMTDSISDYLAHPGDSIDFSNGPVKLRVRSESGTAEMVYQVKVNVHQVKPDTLAWSMMESAQLPSSFGRIDAQGAACLDGVYYYMTESNGKYCLATTDDPAQPDWQVDEVTPGFAARPETLRASSDALYMLATDGALYTSADGQAWTSTGQTWVHIYGGYADQVMGCTTDMIVSYPSGAQQDMPDGFPVSGTSLPALYTTPMGASQQLVMFGGRTADGTVVKGVWGYDGNSWAFLTTRPADEALEDATLVAYDLFDVPISTWKPQQYPALVVFGGKNAHGSVNRTVYISADWGMTWREAPELMQLPAQMPAMYQAPAFVHATTMHASRANDWWTPLAVRPLYPGCSFELPRLSRYDQPITEWQCPAIYIFGGRMADGTALNTLWRGCILRYTFQPKF